MRGEAIRPIVIAAGGTGGHLFPAEALAAELARRGRRIALMTDARSGGMNSPVFEGRERFVLSGSGVFGGGAMRALRAGVALIAGTVQARSILARLDAAAVVGFGGYPSVPPLLAARTLRRRPALVLHEQNAVLGRANRVLARISDHVALSHGATARLPPGAAGSVTGNPVRPAIAALAERPYVPPAETINLLVLGGSLGARVFSDVVPAATGLLKPELRTRLRITQQCRPEDLERVRLAYAALGMDADLSRFFPDIAERLAAAHLVIARAGGSTVAELAVAGRPAILVPLPIAIDDDQGANAGALAEAGGAWMMRQKTFSPVALAERLAALTADPSTLARASAAARSCGHPDAAGKLADLVETFAAQESLA